MPQTLGQNFQDVQDAALPVLDKAARTTNEEIVTAIDAQLNEPLRLSATSPIADAVLNIGSNQVSLGNGVTRSSPPADDTLQVYAATTINFQTGATAGGTITLEGGVFSLPSTTVGQFRRMVLGYISADNAVDTLFSAEAASQGALADPGLLFGSVQGTPIGYIDLEATAATAFKTAGSVSNVIENTGVFTFGSGAGGGAGGDESFVLQSISGSEATLKGGFIIDNGGREYATYDGSEYGVNITVDLDTVLGGSPADATTYHLYIDRELVAAAATETATGRKLIQVQQPQFALLTDAPDLVDQTRYIPVSLIRSADTGTAWTGAGAEQRDLARRYHVGADLLRFDQEFTAQPASTIAHGLGERPDFVSVLHNELGDGRYVPLDNASYVKVDDFGIYTSGFGSLTIDGTRQLRIIAFKTQRAADVTLSNLNNFKPGFTEYSAGPQTAADAEYILADTVGGAWQLNLPASPANTTRVVVYDAANNFATANLTVGRNGSNIEGAASDDTLDVDGAKVEYIYVGGSIGWKRYIV